MVFFQTVRRDSRTVVVGVRVTIAERHALLSEATRRGMTMTELVRDALGQYIQSSSTTTETELSRTEM